LSSEHLNEGLAEDRLSLYVRIFGWGMMFSLALFLINNYFLLTVDSWPISGNISAGIYVVAFASAFFFAQRTAHRGLRLDAAYITEINTFIVRAAFWAVLFIGLADMVISFIRVEGMLPAAFGEEMAKKLGRPQFRGPYVHVPLAFLGIVVAMFTRTLGFTWLALLIVVAELAIVITRFVFSYEQAFMGDLVRFWYAALFLFASAYTLLEEGHVRVDVFYANFRETKKGFVNAWGAVLLGMSLCWTILIIGMGSKSAIINSPVMNFEVSQVGFGMYTKYLMAGFLGLFAITMLIQFVSQLMESVADYKEQPGKRVVAAPGAH